MELQEKSPSTFSTPISLPISTIKQESLEDDVILKSSSADNNQFLSTSHIPFMGYIDPKKEDNVEDVQLKYSSFYQQVYIKEEEVFYDVVGDDDLNEEMLNERTEERIKDEKTGQMLSEPTNSNCVYIKEEFIADEECVTENMNEVQQQTNDINTSEDQVAFGNHFLAECLETEPLNSSKNNEIRSDPNLFNGVYGEPQDSYYGNGIYMCVKKRGLNGDPLDSSNRAGINYQSSQQIDKQFCILCCRTVKKMSIEKHMTTAHVVRQCQYCNFKSAQKGVLRNHVIRKHNFGQEPINCPYCKYMSLSIMDMENHIEAKHRRSKVYFYCNECDYKASSQCNLKYHITSKHTSIKNYACPFCDYKCIIYTCMKRHGIKVHNKRITLENSLLKLP